MYQIAQYIEWYEENCIKQPFSKTSQNTTNEKPISSFQSY